MTNTPLSYSIEPTTRAFLEEINPAPPIYTLSVEEARKVLSDLQAVNVAKLSADIEDHQIPGGPKGQVSIRIIRPKGITRAPPVIMFFHGGGWVLGDKDTHDRLVREIANGANAAVVFVDYTRSPEAQYPTAIEEAYAATKYVAEHGKTFDLDSSRLAVVGDSVGGNMAIAVTLLAKERGGPHIGFQVLFYPVTDANFNTPSYNELATGHWLTREAMKWFWNNYLLDEGQRAYPTASPLRASVGQLKGLPPALIMNGEFDVLRHECEAYAHKLNEAGVRVTAVRFLGTIHDFVMLNTITNTPAPRSAIALANDNLEKFFANERK
ncbi:MAG TPA: alpha/beta hydrolase [Candidatus Acidoferrales bacterium]|nr:alpha/beta hydrolase [Candidatus Acidoferrales bacterium]